MQGSPTDPFHVQALSVRYLKTILGIVRLVAMLRIWLSLSLRNNEGLMYECDIKISHQTVRY